MLFEFGHYNILLSHALCKISMYVILICFLAILIYNRKPKDKIPLYALIKSIIMLIKMKMEYQSHPTLIIIFVGK